MKVNSIMDFITTVVSRAAMGSPFRFPGPIMTTMITTILHQITGVGGGIIAGSVLKTR
jgi:hypothetical protein